MSSSSSNKFGGVGNNRTPPNVKKERKSQISPSVHWCFTAKVEDISGSSMSSILSQVCKSYVFQKEIPDKKDDDEFYAPYIHWQGYMAFKKKSRPFEIGLPKSTHWSKTRSVKHSIAYCSKDDTCVMPKELFKKNIRIPRPLHQITYESLRPWQKELAEGYKDFADPYDRTINWYWEPEGKIGKSILVKYFVDQRGAVTVSGKGSDCLYAIQQYVEKNGEGPDIIIIDIPRCVNLEYVSYTAIEKLKDGCFFSGKYEGGMVRINTPHIIIFANEEPHTEKMSRDRWRVKKLDKLAIYAGQSLPAPCSAGGAGHSALLYHKSSI